MATKAQLMVTVKTQQMKLAAVLEETARIQAELDKVKALHTESLTDESQTWELIESKRRGYVNALLTVENGNAWKQIIFSFPKGHPEKFSFYEYRVSSRAAVVQKLRALEEEQAIPMPFIQAYGFVKSKVGTAVMRRTFTPSP